MRYVRKFKDDFIVIFDGDKFTYNDVKYRIYGVTGVDVDLNKIQLRDDTLVIDRKSKKHLSFEQLCKIWTQIEPLLVKIVIKKELIPRK